MRALRRRAPWLTLLCLAACTASPPLPDPEPAHPASPVAEEAPERAPSSTLRMPVRTPRAASAGKGH